MEPDILVDIFQVATPTGLIIVGVWFAINELWPFFKVRDKSVMEFEQAMNKKQVESDLALAGALTALANHLENPIRVRIEPKE